MSVAHWLRTGAVVTLGGALAFGLGSATNGGQTAAVYGFVGSIAILVPPVRQVFNNLPFRFLDKPRNGRRYEMLTKEARILRSETYTGFSWFDAGLYAAGATLLALSFWKQF